MVRTPYQLLDWASRTLAPFHCECVIAWGSAVLDDFDLDSSDVDLVVVFDPEKVDITLLQDVARKLLPEGYDVLLWPRTALSEQCPQAWHATTERWRIVHAIEVFLIRNHSRVIYGRDLRYHLWDVSHLDSLRISALFFYDSLRRFSKERMEKITALEFVQYARTAVRVLAEFESKVSLSKKGSVQWVLDQKRGDSFTRFQSYAKNLLEWETRHVLPISTISEIIKLASQYLNFFLTQKEKDFSSFSIQQVTEELLSALRNHGGPLQEWVNAHIDRVDPGFE